MTYLNLPQMDETIRLAWAAALTSGDYEQATQTLHDPEQGYCCLGVLCDLAVKAGIVTERTLVTSSQYGMDPIMTQVFTSVADRFDESGGVLPLAVSRWAGIVNNDLVDHNGEPWCISDPELTSPITGVQMPAGIWNDEEDASFAEIAVMLTATR